MKKKTIGVCGLGYVGLPLAMALDKEFNVIGFDINENRIKLLLNNYDSTNEVKTCHLTNCSIIFTTDPTALKDCDVIIVAVPTPLDDFHQPDLNPIKSASLIVGSNMSKDTLVIYESTVYPGLTEEICIPLLEEHSKLQWKVDFNVGYSPERINPGDKEHTIDKVVKVVSGDTPDTAKRVKRIYNKIVKAGIHVAPSIKVAEAAKVIENVQRDVNIALINELSNLFRKMGISIKDVLEASGTKWNFLKFEPGLVGGHCIGVDPLYLVHKARKINFTPDIIIAGRRINSNMGRDIAQHTLHKIIDANKYNNGNNKILLCGLSFKENVPDTRNTGVMGIYNELDRLGFDVTIYDPIVPVLEAKQNHGLNTVRDIRLLKDNYLAVILAVKHDEIVKQFTLKECMSFQEGMPIIIDVKQILDKDEVEAARVSYFSL